MLFVECAYDGKFCRSKRHSCLFEYNGKRNVVDARAQENSFKVSLRGAYLWIWDTCIRHVSAKEVDA